MLPGTSSSLPDLAERQLLKWNCKQGARAGDQLSTHCDPASSPWAREAQPGLHCAKNREAKLPGTASGRGRGRSRSLGPGVPTA